MRINVYEEELPFPYEVENGTAIEVVSKQTYSGKTFFGIRVYLQSSDELHNTQDDDDRSAITFWGPREKLSNTFDRIAKEILTINNPDELI